MRSLPTLLTFVTAAILASAAAGSAGTDDWNTPSAQLAAYPFHECVVCETDLERGSTDRLHDGRLIRVCSATCQESVDASPNWYLERIDTALLEQQGTPYPLTDCAVCRRDLDAEGGGVDHVRGARLVRLCGDECLLGFRVDPHPAMAFVDAAWIEAQRDSYPTEMCPVMGMEIDAMESPTEILHGTRLVRLCCDSCADTFRNDPATWLTELDRLVE